jgi:hypothetical protein
MIITTEAEANAAEIGTVVRDGMGDVHEKVSQTGWEQPGLVGAWGPTWIAYPAVVLESP